MEVVVRVMSRIVIHFFFLMIRRPPRSTLLTHSFPTRRSSDLEAFFFSLEESRLLGGASPRGRDITFFSARSEEHTSELQSLMRISYAVFCLKKKKIENLKSNASPSSLQQTIHHLHITTMNT